MTEAPLWTPAEVVAAIDGHATAIAGDSFPGVSIDSRTVLRGELFVALVGPSFDGHDFVADALKRGAGAAIVARRPAGLPGDASLIEVGDTLEALTRLGDAARRRSNAKIIAVTGSVGKTGTKEALRHALAATAPCHASVGSFNNQWGVPLSLARMPREVRFAVFEIGMNHAGEIAELTRLVRPEIAIITTIEAAHLEFFDSVGDIADAKAEIFLGMPGFGTAILNRDNPFFPSLAIAAADRGIGTVIGFGAHPEATARLLTYHPDGEGGAVTALIDGQEVAYRMALPGRHLAMNSLAVLAAVKAAGADLAAGIAALSTLPGLAGRGRRTTLPVTGGTAILIDESYNASPAAMRAAFAVLAGMEPGAGGRRIAVVGDMRELGAEADSLHRGLAGPLAAAGADLVFAAGPHMAALIDALPHGIAATHRPTAAELAPLVADALRPGDVIMVKGSLGTRMADIVRPLLSKTPQETAVGS
ncbi:MAG TPA: UDP-N-acetylmuramoylalanyl-D-glutamyl-2,6-diaminopimelate--D-alanyl-D-alanine ligase [Stellaceae bacterium]|nr:UDP-N-acetylmuramoylalanyl-D-glutamyl-2,6-diaminopimelate--D-alanyl-D-alanine ligase [Stellaceae bacterium]